MKNLLFTLALLVSFNSFGQSKADKKIEKKLKLEIINKGIDFSGDFVIFIDSDSNEFVIDSAGGYGVPPTYKDHTETVVKNWEMSFFKNGLETGSWYVSEDNATIINGDYKVEVYGNSMIIKDANNNFSTVAIINYNRTSGLNTGNNKKGADRRDYILRKLKESNR